MYNMIGHDVMKRGLHIYFDKHEWKNTVLSDFVGALEQAYNESGKKELGENFNFTEWCD